MSKLSIAAQTIIDAENALIAEQNVLRIELILTRAEGLNFWGKKIDASREKVIATLASEFDLDSDNIAEILATIARPEKAKKDKVAKEKAIDTRPVTAGSLTHAESVREVISGSRFLVTSAQNNTPVHAEFLKNLEAYAQKIDAKIIVFPFLYNKNGFQNGEAQDEIWYDPAVIKYMQSESAWLGDNAQVSALAFNILPTVKAPLSGMREAIGSAHAVIVPHATLAHECVPVLGAQYGRIVPQLYSTGTVTQRNYIQQQAGHKAENRHNFAALIVEFNDNGSHWIRQIETDETGIFQDLRNYVCESTVTDSNIAVINYGDIHAEKIDETVAAMQWGGKSFNDIGPDYSMLDYLRPAYQMAHDLLDFEALNHHNRENHYHMAENYFNDRTVSDDLSDVSNILSSMSRAWCKTVIVRSNHDDALDRWLIDGKYEPRKDPANALIYYQLQVAAYIAAKDGEKFDSLPVSLALVEQIDVTNFEFLRASQSYIVNGVELGEHGHSGINGSRGSPKQFSGSKCTTGHTHSSSIYGGCYTAGVSGKLAMGYNETGASSWVHASVIQYVTGFRSVVHLKDNGAGNLAFKAD